MIRMIALDLDGTLLDSSRRIPPENVAAIERALARGIEVVLASGRNAASLSAYWTALGRRGPIVSSNGAYVLDREGTELHHLALSDPLRDRLLAYGQENGLHTAVYSRNRILSSRRNPWAELYESRLHNATPEQVRPEDLSRLPATKVLFVDDPGRILEHRARLGPVFADTTYMTISEPEYLEFLSPDANKSAGVAALAERMGIAREEVAAMGDAENDLEMVAWAGFGAAPANAIDAVKEVADRVFASNEEAGASQFIDSIVYNL